MERIQKSISVDCPLQAVYNQWTQFEEFPRFMEGVKHVTQLDDKRLHWEAELGGKHKEWNARITEQIPDHRIAWESESGENTSGIVNFQSEGTAPESISNYSTIQKALSNQQEIRSAWCPAAWRMI